MKHRFIFILFLAIISSSLFGQDKNLTTEGVVSFVTSKNIYVKFENTKHINIGDTLQFSTGKTPCLLVKNKSSKSCVCSIINECDVKKGDAVFYIQAVKTDENTAKEKSEKEIVNNTDSVRAKKETLKKSVYTEKIRGKISVASYNTLSNIRDDRHRIMSRFSLRADHINNSKFSFDSYLTYRRNFISAESKTSQETSFFNIYNLAIKYNVDPTLSFVIGRKINNKISSLGAIDGLQVEKHFGKNYIGIIAGFRPDVTDYSFNSNLLEYGAYIGRRSDKENFYSQTTFGLIEQKNGSEIDRRYTYLQYSSTIFKRLFLFSSLELDLYNKVNDLSSNNVRLTNLYLSARYRFSRKADVTLSYDSRKRILYYETFQTEIERLLDDDIARQGIRIRVNMKPKQYMHVGLSYSKRFQSDHLSKSDNFYAYMRMPKVPGLGGSLSVNFNQNSSNYLASNVVSFRHSRTLIKKKLNADFYYRFVNYVYLNDNIINTTVRQDYYGANLSLNINRRLRLSVSSEFSNSSQENNYRIYTKLVKRFYSKRKK